MKEPIEDGQVLSSKNLMISSKRKFAIYNYIPMEKSNKILKNYKLCITFTILTTILTFLLFTSLVYLSSDNYGMYIMF